MSCVVFMILPSPNINPVFSVLYSVSVSLSPSLPLSPHPPSPPSISPSPSFTSLPIWTTGPFLCILTPDLCCSSIKVKACCSNPTPSLELGSSANSPLSPLDSCGLYSVNIFMCNYYASGTILGTFSLSVSSKVLLTLLGGIGCIVFTSHSW